MKGNEMLNILENIDPAYIEAASAIPKVKKTSWVKKWGSIAACIILLLSTGFGTYTYAQEIKEYNAAIKFFNDNDLSTQGLTRGEIKKIYRDITTESFTYTKTAQVIANSMTSEQVEGFEIMQDNPTPEDVENLWEYKNSSGRYINYKNDGIHYKYYSDYTADLRSKFIQSNIEKYDGEDLVWSVAIKEFSISGFSDLFDGVIIYGSTLGVNATQRNYAWLAKLDTEGTIIWKKKMDHGFDYEYIEAVLENTDGSYAVMSSGDFDHFCLSQYSSEGKETYFKKNENVLDVYGIIRNATCFEDGYIVSFSDICDGEIHKIVKVDYDGNIMDSFSYSSKEYNYHIMDMIEFDGKIYISAYTTPKNEYSSDDIYNIKKYLIDNDITFSRNFSSEEITPMVRDNFKAILLVCDPKIGTPQEFYSVDGSIGGELSLSESLNLLWDVESITTTQLAPPMVSSHTMSATCYVYRYTFDELGVLISQEKTDEVTKFGML